VLISTLNVSQMGLPHMFINVFGRVWVIEICLITKARDLLSGLVRGDVAFIGWEIRDGKS